MTDPDHVRERLSEERDRLQGIKNELDGVRGEDQRESLEELSSYDQHPADVATETFEREKDLSILDSVEGELADIEHALKRIDDGSYGTCEACGKPIGDDRLEAMPATRYCLDDQSKAENEQRISAPHEIVEEEEPAT
ncbi:MAG TPA: TraR/DksA C4-type zinc finger protein [Acidimicrobiales bacterium]|nr:TraR/DksA C4-type zinc finger protein [Acidimicrobiales bacterium]